MGCLGPHVKLGNELSRHIQGTERSIDHFVKLPSRNTLRLFARVTVNSCSDSQIAFEDFRSGCTPPRLGRIQCAGLKFFALVHTMGVQKTPKCLTTGGRKIIWAQLPSHGLRSWRGEQLLVRVVHARERI